MSPNKVTPPPEFRFMLLSLVGPPKNRYGYHLKPGAKLLLMSTSAVPNVLENVRTINPAATAGNGVSDDLIHLPEIGADEQMTTKLKLILMNNVYPVDPSERLSDR